MSIRDAVTLLRLELVPDGYQPYPFRANTAESFLDKLRSLVATYRYRHLVQFYKESGIDFSLYLYAPEFDSTIGEYYHERKTTVIY